MWRRKVPTSLLKSPFHELGHDTILMTYTGKMNDRKLTVPIQYFTIKSKRLLAFIERDSQWWQNLGESDVELNARHESQSARPLLIDDRRAVAELLQNCLLSRPDLAHTYHVGIDRQGLLDVKDILRVSRKLVAVYLTVYTVLDLQHHILP